LKATSICLDHAGEELVDEGLAVSVVTALDEVAALLVHATLGGSELEGPESVGDSAEVSAGSVDLVDEVLSADDILVVELVLDLLVVVDLDALAVDLEVTALVDELADGREGGITVGNVGLDHTEHGVDGLVELQEDSVVDLTETEELEDLLGLGGDLGDTADTGNNDDLGGSLEVEVAVGLGLAAKSDELLLSTLVGLGVLKTADVGLLLELSLLLVLGLDSLLEGLSLLLLEGSALDSGLRGGDSGHFTNAICNC
jgi:hypothetical protein